MAEQQAARQNDFSDPFLTAGLSDLLQYDAAAAFQYPPPSNCDELAFLTQGNFDMPNFDNFMPQNSQPQGFESNNFRDPPPDSQLDPLSFNHPQ